MALVIVLPKGLPVARSAAQALIARNSAQNATRDGTLCQIVMGRGAQSGPANSPKGRTVGIDRAVASGNDGKKSKRDKGFVHV